MIRKASDLTTNCADCGAEPGEFCTPDCPNGKGGGFREQDVEKED